MTSSKVTPGYVIWGRFVPSVCVFAGGGCVATPQKNTNQRLKRLKHNLEWGNEINKPPLRWGGSPCAGKQTKTIPRAVAHEARKMGGAKAHLNTLWGQGTLR